MTRIFGLGGLLIPTVLMTVGSDFAQRSATAPQLASTGDSVLVAVSAIVFHQRTRTPVGTISVCGHSTVFARLLQMEMRNRGPVQVLVKAACQSPTTPAAASGKHAVRIDSIAIDKDGRGGRVHLSARSPSAAWKELVTLRRDDGLKMWIGLSTEVSSVSIE